VIKDLAAVYTVGDSTPGLNTDKIRILCGPYSQEREFATLKQKPMAGFGRTQKNFGRSGIFKDEGIPVKQ